MASKTCPHLGRRDDQDTLFNFPSPGNFCHHSHPISPPSEDHQHQHCLSSLHRECPVYRAPAGERLPPSIQIAGWGDPNPISTGFLKQFSLWQISLFIVIGMIILTGAIFLAITANAGSFLSSPLEGLSTSTLIPTRTFPPSIPTPAPPTETALIPTGNSPQPSSSPSETPTTEVCGPPPGWVTHTVRSGDTLFTISTATDTPVAQLQQANCLGDSTQIITGQKLHVPKLPEFPTTTPTIAFIN